MKMIKNDLSPQACVSSVGLDNQPSTSSASDFYGLTLQQTKETLYKDIPSSSKNFNLDQEIKNKCTKPDNLCINVDALSLQSKDNKMKIKKEILNNSSRRYSDSSAMRNSQVSGTSGRFTTTLVTEDQLKPESSDSKSSNNLSNVTNDQVAPLITKAKNSNVKPGFYYNWQLRVLKCDKWFIFMTRISRNLDVLLVEDFNYDKQALLLYEI